MIQSMTGFGSAQATNEAGSVTVEIRSVNSRYLDLSMRLPDELRLAEMALREIVSHALLRGKVEVRASFIRAQKDVSTALTQSAIDEVRAAYEQIKRSLPDSSPPTFADVLSCNGRDKAVTDPAQWVVLCQKAASEAVEHLIETRLREGSRLVQVIRDQADDAQAIVNALKDELPALLRAQSERIAKRMREAFEQVAPQGLSHISATEISERLAAEASIFSLRADVAEELERLNIHLAELQQTLDNDSPKSVAKGAAKGRGKRLDFLFQEMNREANTLGSKAVDIRLTRAAVDLKLLIEQMREQIQNIE